jgi:TetR/AcrR family transcriptional repressor of multidrug resistance operon
MDGRGGSGYTLRSEYSLRRGGDQTKTTDKETAILDAALQLISRRGFHDAPTSAIAREAGVGVGTIYRYFENKEALIVELYVRLKAQMAKAMLVGYSADLPLRQRFRCLWLNAAHYYIGHPLETSFMEQYASSPFLKSETSASHAEYLRPVLDFVEDGVYEGILKDLPLAIFLSLTLDVALSLAEKHRDGVIMLDAAALERAMDACWDAVKR